MRKKVEKRKTLGFLSFSVSMRFFFIGKTAIIFSEKPTGQQISAILGVFNIVILEVYRRTDEKLH